MKKYRSLHTISLGLIILFSIITMSSMNSCVPSKAVAAKTGVQLWSENCQRCHNTPSPTTFSPEIWETVGMHMQTRALLTEAERDKIVEFLKSAR
ncbi:MAG: cytochrome c [Bacteroidota bacterium]|nr:cytochrome c [Bacteroidota bacterium]